MDSFRTILSPTPAGFRIGHSDQLLLIGSCFSEHIGGRLAARKFNTLANPFGIVYNPVSMARCLERLQVGTQAFNAESLERHMGLWHSWEHHGHFSKPDLAQTLAGINAAYEQAVKHLQGSTRLLLTLGTADVFILKDSGQIVANNHKMPAATFQQKRLDVGEVTDALGAALEKLAQKKDGLQVVLSVSPVRHLRNGMVENQRSKAVLVLACEALCRQLTNAHYFPAYELLLDDLRDYRFYNSDMLHPSELAVAYIWQYFSDMFFSSETKQLNTAIEKILAAAAHRPFNPDTAAHRGFAAQQLAAIAALKQEWPGLDFVNEERVFKTE